MEHKLPELILIIVIKTDDFVDDDYTHDQSQLASFFCSVFFFLPQCVPFAAIDSFLPFMA